MTGKKNQDLGGQSSEEGIKIIKIEKDKDKGAEMKCQNIFGWNNRSRERNVKMCESVGGGGAELEFRSDSDRHGELWQKKQATGRKPIKEAEGKFNALQGKKTQRDKEYFLTVRRRE